MENLSCDNSSENDIKRRIGLATGASASLNTIWASMDITQETKLRVYRSLVLSILLYNFETWTLKESDKSRLFVFEMTILRRILGVTRRDRWRNEDIRMTLGLPRTVVDEVQHRRLAYFGHVCRMKAERLPYIYLFGRIHGSRPVGRPKKKCFDDVRTDCAELGLSTYGYIASRLFRIRLFPCSPISYLPIPYLPILCWPILYSSIPCLPIPYSPTPCSPIPCSPTP